MALQLLYNKMKELRPIDFKSWNLIEILKFYELSFERRPFYYPLMNSSKDPLQGQTHKQCQKKIAIVIF